MRIEFDYGWYDDDKTIMRYAARDNWTWKDFHAVVHVSLFAFHTHTHPVHMLIDLSTGKRERFPSGIAAHARTFGKKIAPNISGNAVVIGLPLDVQKTLGIAESKRLKNPDGVVIFVENEREAEVIFAEWHTQQGT